MINNYPLILIIDDIPENIQVLLNILQKNSYRFAIATNSDDAFKSINAEKPDLILLDVILPRVNGYDICNKIKSDEKTKDIPIIFLTVLDDVDDILRGFQMGAADYITKPFNEYIVLARVENILKTKKIELELKEINKNKDRFISILAHDLKNPFSNILSFSKLLVQGGKKILNEEKTIEMLEAIYTDALRGNNLLENLLIWSYSSNQSILQGHIESFKLNDLVMEIFELYQTNSLKKGLKLINNVPDGLILNSDKNMILTILRNLVSNAIKFTYEGEIMVAAEESENDILVSVSDTGIGISKANLGKILDSNNQFSTPGTDLERGTGMGLAIINIFVKQNGGELIIDSEQGKGSRFSFTIPIQ